MTVGEKIYTLRTQAGYSQEEFAEIIGVSRQSVSKWETSAVMPDTEYVIKICKLLQVSTDTLLLDNDLLSAKKEQDDSANGVSDNQLDSEVLQRSNRRVLSALGLAFSFISGVVGLILSCFGLRRESRASAINHLAVSGIAISCVKIFTTVTFAFVYGVMTVVYRGAL